MKPCLQDSLAICSVKYQIIESLYLGDKTEFDVSSEGPCRELIEELRLIPDEDPSLRVNPSI